MNMLKDKTSYVYSLRYYEKDLNLNLKPVSILNFMQDTAALHAEVNGFGKTFVFSKNMAWFVLKYKIEMFKNINDLQNIEIKTESRGTSKLFAYRDFNFYSNGEMFGRASSLWALVDFETKRMAKTQDVIPFLPAYEKREDDLEFEKIPSITDATNKKEFDIRFDDIDVNQHVNNPVYLAWALEALNFEFKTKYLVKSIDMYFKKEIAFGGKIISEVQVDEDSLVTIHSIKNAETNEELCAIKIEWQ